MKGNRCHSYERNLPDAIPTESFQADIFIVCFVGYHVLQSCNRTTDTECAPCERNTYTALWNRARRCFGCSPRCEAGMPKSLPGRLVPLPALFCFSDAENEKINLNDAPEVKLASVLRACTKMPLHLFKSHFSSVVKTAVVRGHLLRGEVHSR